MTGSVTWNNVKDIPLGFADNIDNVGAAESKLAIQLGGVNVSSPTAVINFNSEHFSIVEDPANESNVSITTPPFAMRSSPAAYAKSIAVDILVDTITVSKVVKLDSDSYLAIYQSSAAYPDPSSPGP